MLAKLNAFSGSLASVNISTKKKYTIKSREAKQREILTTQDINAGYNGKNFPLRRKICD